MQIDHDPNEPQRPKDDGMWWLWPACFLLLIVLWIWVFFTEPMNWTTVGLAFATGMLFAYWSTETFPGPYRSISKK